MTSATAVHVPAASELRTLREVVEEHAGIERAPGSDGERHSAQLLHDRLRAAGARSRIEPATYLDGWQPILAANMAVPILANVLGGRARRRLPWALVSAAAGALLADDVSNGPRLLRRALRRRRATQNVVAEIGDPADPIGLVVMAHHDAARTGVMFDQSLQQAVHARFPKQIESMKASLPFWWLAAGAPVLAGLGLLTGRRSLRLIGSAGSAMGVYWMGDMARNPVVPGANDNLSAVAVLVALAERWREQPIAGMRVLLVSAGAEESMQGGIYGFMEAHGEQLRASGAKILNPDTVGSSHLVMLEGEGTMRMHDYDPAFRDEVAAAAEAGGVPIERGLRSRFSTDGIVPTRAGIPTVSLASLEPWRALANYHLMSDTPENLNYETVAHTVQLADTLARRLAAAR